MSSDNDLDRVLRAAFEPDSDKNVAERMGARSRILLHDAPEDPTPLVKVSQANPIADDSRYEIVGEIGRGGVGVVYKSRDKDLGRDVALKVLRTEHVDRSDVLERFIEEAQIGGQLQHPGIVPVYSLGLQPDGRPFFTMKLVKGRTLAVLLKGRKDPGRDRRRLLRIFQRTCQTMAYAHSRGVLHRDLKPSNLMVGNFGEVQVVDWGFGKVIGRPEPPRADEERTVVATVRSGSGSESITGSVMGTPAYMPPEQALGQVEELDEQSDVFALGAILCQILTGVPPYSGPEKDLLVQAAHARLDDAFARLDDCGAAAELVALTKRCLSPLRSNRPENAGEVAQRIADHLVAAEERAHAAEVEAIHERARLAKERRNAVWEKGRKGKTRIVAAALVAAVVLGGGAYLWNDAQNRSRAAEARRQVEEALEQATHLDAANRWTEALAVTRTAVALAAAVDAEMRERAEALARQTTEKQEAADAAARKAKVDRGFVDRLEEIRLQRTEHLDDQTATDAAYAKVFRDHGLDPAASETAAAIRERFPRIALALASALDEWAWIRRKYLGTDWQTLDAIARRIDPDTWRNRLRDAMGKKNLAALHALREEALEKQLPVRSLDQLGVALWEAGDAEACARFLRAVHRVHPDDLWINYHLSAVLSDSLSSPNEALPFATAARALKPRSATMWRQLGKVLKLAGDLDAAESAVRESLRLEPDSPRGYNTLGATLLAKSQLDEALVAFRKAVELDPGAASAHVNITICLYKKGSLEETIRACRAYLDRFPENARLHHNLGLSLATMGKRREAIASYRDALRLEPKAALTHDAIGWALLKLGQLDKAADSFRKAIRHDRGYASAHCGLGRVFQTLGRHDKAIPNFREAIRLKPSSAWLHALGSSQTNMGLIEEGIVTFREALRLQPDFANAHCDLGFALFASGEFEESLKHARRGHELGMRRPDWREPSAAWVQLYKNAIEYDRRLPAVLSGKEQPASPHESYEFAVVCFIRKRYVDALRLYREAMAKEPPSSSSLETAGIAAVAAGCGLGVSPPADEKTRARCRAQALQWLRAAFDQYRKHITARRIPVISRLNKWRCSVLFMSVRDEKELRKLPAAEQVQWRAFWKEVAEAVGE